MFIYWYTIWRARRRGKKDAKKGILRRIPPPYEEELYNLTERDLQRLSEKWRSLDESLRVKCREAQNEYLKIKKDFDKLTDKEKKIISAYEAAQSEFDSIGKPLLNRWIYYIAAIIIFFGEYILNSIVFNIFGETRLFTLGMASGLGVAIIIAGHELGKIYRQEKRTKEDYIMICLGLGLFLVLGAISYLRLKYYEASKMAQMLGININPIAFFLIFWIINLFLVLVCALMAYLSSPTDLEEFERLKQRLKEAKKEFKKLSKEQKKLGKKLFSVRKKWDTACIKRKIKFEIFQDKVVQEIKDTSIDIWAYRGAYLNNFKGEIPQHIKQYLNKDPKENIQIPPSLIDIDCTGCIYEQIKPLFETGEEETIKGIYSRTTPVPVPLILTEINNFQGAKALLESFSMKIGLNLNIKGIDQKELCIYLEKQNPRNETESNIWKEACLDILEKWDSLDKKLQQTFPQGYIYHLYPHMSLPMAFIIGSVVDLRRRIYLYHSEAQDFFEVFDLTDSPRILTQEPPKNIDAPKEEHPQQTSKNNQKIILHFFVSGRHKLSFKNHPEFDKFENLGLVYNTDLPRGDWLGYAQHFIKKTQEIIPKYNEIEICLLCPCSFAFALGMGLSREPKISVCQWFSDKSPPVYLKILSLKDMEPYTTKFFS